MFFNFLVRNVVPLGQGSEQSNIVKVEAYHKVSLCCRVKPFSLLNGSSFSRAMSTSKGRSMRSKVERRMQKESGKTLREIRRAKKLKKKLMTEEERLIYNLKRVNCYLAPLPITVWTSYIVLSCRKCLTCAFKFYDVVCKCCFVDVLCYSNFKCLGLY